MYLRLMLGNMETLKPANTRTLLLCSVEAQQMDVDWKEAVVLNHHDLF